MAGKFQSPGTSDAPTDTTNFDTNLSAADDTVQKALETIDEFSLGGGGGVDSIAKSGDTQLTGDITLSEGANVTLTQVGQDISIAASGSGFTGTEGSIPFVGPGGGLIEDNAKFFFDNANDRLGIGVAAPTESLDISGRIKATGGIDSGASGIFTKRKVITMGTWDIDTVATISVAHGLTLLDIRSIVITIRNDAGTEVHPAGSSDAGTDLSVHADTTNIVLSRPNGSPFNNVAYSSTAFDRGWIVIEFV